ncbi:GNAT family N-acetyltransferase [Pseudomonas sp. WS 5410]|uniref:GNAT family N-acetyltransferase n=1 Tax=Pseudomonas sp. WS 5410 TaxID=2717485 RepID=UPI0014763CE1|nr:GNAT family N-acetyltransferase [Pseudomonas sp. WS 5410]NMY20830.1 GNAT family N-acetyltransferase [Pseudomonas sp. WS 5410]
MIRAAKHSDVPRLIELGTMLHDISSYSALAFSPEKSAAFLHELINGHNGVVFVAEINGEVVGGMAGGIVDQWFSEETIAYDYSVFIEPSRRSGFTARRLILAFVEWARIRGARHVQLGIGTKLNVEGTSKLYQSLGFEVFAPLFQMEFK